jgi:hypothetical protein
MKRMFIETNEFRSRWEELGLTEEDLRELQNFLLEHPEAGPVIEGTGVFESFDGHGQGEGNREALGRSISIFEIERLYGLLRSSERMSKRI